MKAPKCQKSLSTKSFLINLKGDFAEFVDGFLLALVNDVQILFRHLDTCVSEQRRNSLDVSSRIEQIDCETMTGAMKREYWNWRKKDDEDEP